MTAVNQSAKSVVQTTMNNETTTGAAAAAECKMKRPMINPPHDDAAHQENNAEPAVKLQKTNTDVSVSVHNFVKLINTKLI